MTLLADLFGREVDTPGALAPGAPALVYIAGPYSHPDPVVNTRSAVNAGLRVHELTGAGVIIPHLTLLAHAMRPHDIDYWYRFDLAQVEHCTHLLRLPGSSTGADREVEFAQARGIPVYLTLDDLLAARGITSEARR